MPALSGPLSFLCNMFQIMVITKVIHQYQNFYGYKYNLHGIYDRVDYLYGIFGYLVFQAFGMSCVSAGQVKTYAVKRFNSFLSYSMTFVGIVTLLGMINVRENNDWHKKKSWNSTLYSTCRLPLLKKIMFIFPLGSWFQLKLFWSWTSLDIFWEIDFWRKYFSKNNMTMGM